PSPLSAKKFFGSKPFSSTNQALRELGQEPISWQLPEQPTEEAPAGPARPAAPAPTVKPALAAPAAPAPVVKEPPTHLETLLPEDWRAALADELKKPSFRGLDKFLAGERKDYAVCPTEEEVFRAFAYAPLDRVRLVILGSEPPCDE